MGTQGLESSQGCRSSMQSVFETLSEKISQVAPSHFHHRHPRHHVSSHKSDLTQGLLAQTHMWTDSLGVQGKYHESTVVAHSGRCNCPRNDLPVCLQASPLAYITVSPGNTTNHLRPGIAREPQQNTQVAPGTTPLRPDTQGSRLMSSTSWVRYANSLTSLSWPACGTVHIPHAPQQCRGRFTMLRFGLRLP